MFKNWSLSDITEMVQIIIQIITAILTVIIAWLVYRTTVTIAKAQQLYNLNQQWLMLIYAVLPDDKTVEIVQELRSKPNIRSTRKDLYALAFFGILENYYSSMKERYMSDEEYDNLVFSTTNHFKFEKGYVEDILSQGFDKEFKKDFLKRSERLKRRD